MSSASAAAASLNFMTLSFDVEPHHPIGLDWPAVAPLPRSLVRGDEWALNSRSRLREAVRAAPNGAADQNTSSNEPPRAKPWEIDMRVPMRSKMALALVALSCLAVAQPRAQDFPSRIVRVVVAFPAGGPTDFVARLLADKLKPLIGQNVIVENRPGANGAIGADYVAKGEADGHLLFLTTVGAVAITPHLAKPAYDPIRDFAAITLVVRNTT